MPDRMRRSHVCIVARTPPRSSRSNAHTNSTVNRPDLASSSTRLSAGRWRPFRRRLLDSVALADVEVAALSSGEQRGDLVLRLCLVVLTLAKLRPARPREYRPHKAPVRAATLA